RAGALRRRGAGARDLRAGGGVRERPRAPVGGGRRRHRRVTRQLSPGVQPRRAGERGVGDLAGGGGGGGLGGGAVAVRHGAGQRLTTGAAPPSRTAPGSAPTAA